MIASPNEGDEFNQQIKIAGKTYEVILETLKSAIISNFGLLDFTGRIRAYPFNYLSIPRVDSHSKFSICVWWCAACFLPGAVPRRSLLCSTLRRLSRRCNWPDCVLHHVQLSHRCYWVWCRSSPRCLNFGGMSLLDWLLL